MANYLTLVPFILQEEGGLSKATTDAASADPVPDGSGYHTNKGITWQTFQSFMSQLGIPDIATAITRFYAMSDSDWDYIFKTGYWDPSLGDSINSQGAANILVDWGWGSGIGTAVKKLQQFLTGPSGWIASNGGVDPQLSIDGGMGNMTLAALNAATQINEAQFISDFSAYHEQWLQSLPGQSANQAGWAARVAALEQLAMSTLSSTTGQTVIISVILIGGLLTFFFTEILVG